MDGTPTRRALSVFPLRLVSPVNEGSKTANRKKKSCSFEIWQNCRGERPEQHTKSPC